MTGRKPEGGSSESGSEAEDGAGKSPGKKVTVSMMATFEDDINSGNQNHANFLYLKTLCQRKL